MTVSPVVTALQAPITPRTTKMPKNVNSGDIKIVEARITRSLRIALAAALIVALVIPVAESALVISTTGKLVMRSMDAVALLAIAVSLINAFLLNRRLNKKSHSR